MTNRKSFQIPVEIGDRKLLIKPYTSKVEKDILIMSSFEIFDADEALRVLGVKKKIRKSLSNNEKKALLYKYREVSHGNEIDIKFNCKKCNKTNESAILASDFIVKSNLDDSDILKIDKEVTENNLSDYLINNIDLEELDIDEYEALLNRVKLNQNKFNFTKICKCLSCKADNIFDIGSEKYIIEQLSDSTLVSLYKTYTNMIMFGNMSKADIDEMYPFEREIFIGLISKTKEDMGK